MEKFCKPKISAARSRTTLIGNRVRQLDHQARAERARAAEFIVAENRAQVVFDLIDEAPAIAAFERDFMISADQVTHFFAVISTQRFMICYRPNGASMSKSNQWRGRVTADESLIVTRREQIEKLRRALHQSDPEDRLDSRRRDARGRGTGSDRPPRRRFASGVHPALGHGREPSRPGRVSGRPGRSHR